MLTQEARDADARFDAAAAALAQARRRSATRLDKAVNAELAPLRLERAKLSTNIERAEPGPTGTDRVEFWVQTNPGTRPGPLMKVASGGELARFLLALKVVLADRGQRRRWCSMRWIPVLVARSRMRSGCGLRALAARSRFSPSPTPAGRGTRPASLSDQQGCARQRQAGRNPSHRACCGAPPRGDRPDAGGRGNHRRSARRGRAIDAGQRMIVLVHES